MFSPAPATQAYSVKNSGGEFLFQWDNNWNLAWQSVEEENVATVRATVLENLPVLGPAEQPPPPSHHITYFVILLLAARPPSPPPSLSYHDSLTSGSGRPAGIWSNKQNNEAELQSPGRSWTAKSQEVEVEGTLLAAAAPALWAGGEKIPNKGKLQLPPPSSRLCWAGPH